MLDNLIQVAGKLESVEGTAETLAAADAKTLAFDPKIDFTPDMFEQDPARETFTKLAKIPGKRPGHQSMKILMRGSGTATTEPDWFKYLKPCGTKVSTLNSINIGSITTGPFLHREAIVGTTSGATGRIIIKTATGAAAVYFVYVGTVPFQSGEVITGGTSGATATTSSTPSAVGKVMEPLTSVTLVPSMTLSGYESGVRKMLRGCRGNFKLTFQSGKPCLIDLNYSGVEAGITDLSQLSNIAYDTNTPPILISALFSIDSYSAKISELTIDSGNKLSPRDDVNDTRGLLSFIVGGRDVIGSFDPEMVSVAAHDFHSKWFAGTEMVLDITQGSATGSKFRFYAAKAQYNKIDDANRGNIKIAKCTFDLNGTVSPGDDEWALLHL